MRKQDQSFIGSFDGSSSGAPVSPLSSSKHIDQTIENPEVPLCTKVIDEQFDGSLEVLSEMKQTKRASINNIQNVFMKQENKTEKRDSGLDQFSSVPKKIPESKKVDVQPKQSPENDFKQDSRLSDVKYEDNKQNEPSVFQVPPKSAKIQKIKTKVTKEKQEQAQLLIVHPLKKGNQKSQQNSKTVSSNAHSSTKLQNKQSLTSNPKIKNLKKQPQPCTAIQKLFVSSIVSSACIVTCFLARVDENACALLSTGVFFGTLCVLK